MHHARAVGLAVVVLTGTILGAATAIRRSSELSAIGTVAAFDPASGRLTIATTRGREVFVLEQNTVIRLGARKVKLQEVRSLVGHPVKVRYQVRGEHRTVRAVMIAPERAPSASRRGSIQA